MPPPLPAKPRRREEEDEQEHEEQEREEREEQDDVEIIVEGKKREQDMHDDVIAANPLGEGSLKPTSLLELSDAELQSFRERQIERYRGEQQQQEHEFEARQLQLQREEDNHQSQEHQQEEEEEEEEAVVETNCDFERVLGAESIDDDVFEEEMNSVPLVLDLEPLVMMRVPASLQHFDFRHLSRAIAEMAKIRPLVQRSLAAVSSVGSNSASNSGSGLGLERTYYTNTVSTGSTASAEPSSAVHSTVDLDVADRRGNSSVSLGRFVPGVGGRRTNNARDRDSRENASTEAATLANATAVFAALSDLQHAVLRALSALDLAASAKWHAKAQLYNDNLTDIVCIQRTWRAARDKRKRRDRMRNAIREFVTSERQHGRNLLLMIDKFQQPLEADGYSLATFLGITQDEVHALFGNVGELYAVHVEMLKAMDATLFAFICDDDSDYQIPAITASHSLTPQQCLRDLFETYGPQLKVASEVYAANAETALATLSALSRRSSAAGGSKEKKRDKKQACEPPGASAKSWLAKVESDPSMAQLHLDDLILAPIKRVPQFALMLDTVVKHTCSDVAWKMQRVADSGGPDAINSVPDVDSDPAVRMIRSAFEQVRAVGLAVDDAKAQAEVMGELRALQRRLLSAKWPRSLCDTVESGTGDSANSFELAQQGRRLVRSGLLAVLSDTAEKTHKAQQSIFLFTDLLVRAVRQDDSKHDDDIDSNFRCLAIVDLRAVAGTTLIDEADSSFARNRFKIVERLYGNGNGNARTMAHIFSAADAHEKQEWLEQLHNECHMEILHSGSTLQMKQEPHRRSIVDQVRGRKTVDLDDLDQSDTASVQPLNAVGSTSNTKKGYMVRLGKYRKQWNRRWVVLEDGVLMIYKASKPSEALKEVPKALQLWEYSLRELPASTHGRAHTFQLTNDFKPTVTLGVSHVTDYGEWVSCLREQCAGNMTQLLA